MSFSDWAEKHDKGLKTIAFWAIVGLSGVIGLALGAAGGPLAPLTIPLFGVGFAFLGSLAYAGIVQLINKGHKSRNETLEFPDANGPPLTDQVQETVINAFNATRNALSPTAPTDYEASIQDQANGFWKSYKRQVSTILKYTKESVKGWFRAKQDPDSLSDLDDDADEKPVYAGTQPPPPLRQSQRSLANVAEIRKKLATSKAGKGYTSDSTIANEEKPASKQKNRWWSFQ